MASEKASTPSSALLEKNLPYQRPTSSHISERRFLSLVYAMSTTS